MKIPYEDIDAIFSIARAANEAYCYSACPLVDGGVDHNEVCMTHQRIQENVDEWLESAVDIKP